MADDAPSAAFRDLDELRRALHELIDDRPCRFCGSTDWSATLEPTGDVDSGLPFFRLPGPELHSYAPCFPVICDSCGLVELFEEAKLLAWWRGRAHG